MEICPRCNKEYRLNDSASYFNRRTGEYIRGHAVCMDAIALEDRYPRMAR